MRKDHRRHETRARLQCETLMREENSIHEEQWGEGREKPCVFTGAFRVFWVVAECREVMLESLSIHVGNGEDQMQFIMLPPCPEIATQYVAMGREWGSYASV